MLAIAIIIGVVYLALNFAENLPEKDNNDFHSHRQLSSFKENEQRINERVVQ